MYECMYVYACMNRGPNLVIARVYYGGSIARGEHASFSMVREDIESDRVCAWDMYA